MGIMFAGDPEPSRPGGEWLRTAYRPKHALAGRWFPRRATAILGTMQFFTSRSGSARSQETPWSPSPPEPG